MTPELIAELATAHGGDVALAEDMIAAAADSGAHTVKIQSYTLARLNPADPQRDWLIRAHLDEAAHVRLITACERRGVQFLSTPCDAEAFNLLWRLGQRRVKVATILEPWANTTMSIVKSWAWGRQGASVEGIEAHLTAIPLYPTPLEAVCAVPLLDGWSDHVVGTAACQHMLSRGARMIEAHFCLPGRSRQMPWDKTPEQFREIREWSDTVRTMTTGVSAHFLERWSARAPHNNTVSIT